MPVSASHIVEIPRPLTDREWSFVLADLRETFRAWGNEDTQGETRMWWNNNLHAIVEPTQTGYRLRLGPLKADWLQVVIVLAVAMSIVVAFALGGEVAGFWHARDRAWGLVRSRSTRPTSRCTRLRERQIRRLLSGRSRSSVRR
jgi:hypothetical protein